MNAEQEIAGSFGGIFRGRRVLVTGHTGFKGAWLTEWLLQLGADVTGLSLPPPTQPSLFEQLALAKRIRHIEADVRDAGAVARIMREANPDFVFHLAAQPLVRLSYEQPIETYATNVMGSVHVLDALRQVVRPGTRDQGPETSRQGQATGRERPCVVVMVTTDKCYENKEWLHSYREEDPLGGHDPYSSSKGAAELAIAGYRRSYFGAPDSPVRVASARAGNVIGGGDWALDRIVPDCVRALQKGEPIAVRNRFATRPWQHVLEPLSGYLWLAACLAEPRLTSRHAAHSAAVAQLSGAFNFGPALSSNRTVAELVQEVLKHWPGGWEDRTDPKAVHEAKLLNLAIDKAHHLLGWRPVWDFAATIAETVDWYRGALDDPKRATELTRRQLAEYVIAARAAGVSWTA